MRFLDRHGNPRPLDQVFAEHQETVKSRLRSADAQRRRRIEQHLTDVVMVRGTYGGLPVDGGGYTFEQAARVPNRNPLAW